MLLLGIGQCHTDRGFINTQELGKMTICEQDFAWLLW